ncbi:MAG: TerD family protein [Firmicutes bacterium]|nr:TerD family protein [Bacillota bacterium]
MAISLAKGQKVDLTKSNPGLTNIFVGLGWDVNQYDGGQDFDLDTAAFLLNKEGKVVSDNAIIFYNNLKDASGAIVHSGDNLTGEGEGDDEVINIDLSKVPAEVEKIAFTITIHDAAARNQNFGQVSNAFARIVNAGNKEELIRYDLSEDYSIETALVVAELYRHNGEWKFSAVGAGYEGGLDSLCRSYGINVG